MLSLRLSFALFSWSVLFLATPAGALAPRCLDIFSQKPVITRLKPHVFRVKTAQEDLAYKIYWGADVNAIQHEYDSLLMMSDIVHNAGSKLFSVTQSPRLTKKNEWLLKDEIWGMLMSQRGDYSYSPNSPRTPPEMLMLVTRFETGQEALDFLNDPTITTKVKKDYLDLFWQDIETIKKWLKEHPEYRYKGEKIEITDQYIGDWYEFPSSDGIFEYEYRTVDFRIHGQKIETHVAVDAISNLVITPDSRAVLFDPF